MDFLKKDGNRDKELKNKFIAGFFKRDSKETEGKNQEEKKSAFNQMLTERQQIKKRIEKSLDELLFTEAEKKETFYIIDYTYEQIQVLKDMLIGTNINNDPEEIQNKTMAKITEMTETMYIELKKKVKEIITRRDR